MKLSCGYIDGFYPFCDNLPDKGKVKNIDDESSLDDEWGEKDNIDNNYSIEEIIDMSAMNDVSA